MYCVSKVLCMVGESGNHLHRYERSLGRSARENVSPRSQPQKVGLSTKAYLIVSGVKPKPRVTPGTGPLPPKHYFAQVQVALEPPELSRMSLNRTFSPS